MEWVRDDDVPIGGHRLQGLKPDAVCGRAEQSPQPPLVAQRLARGRGGDPRLDFPSGVGPQPREELRYPAPHERTLDHGRGKREADAQDVARHRPDAALEDGHARSQGEPMNASSPPIPVSTAPPDAASKIGSWK